VLRGSPCSVAASKRSTASSVKPARSELPAALVAIVHADLDAARAEHVEGHARDRDHAFRDEAAPFEAGAPPVADLEAAERPVNAVQAQAADKAALH